jgi:hypothetical protein
VVFGTILLKCTNAGQSLGSHVRKNAYLIFLIFRGNSQPNRFYEDDNFAAVFAVAVLSNFVRLSALTSVGGIEKGVDLERGPDE